MARTKLTPSRRARPRSNASWSMLPKLASRSNPYASSGKAGGGSGQKQQKQQDVIDVGILHGQKNDAEEETRPADAPAAGAAALGEEGDGDESTTSMSTVTSTATTTRFDVFEAIQQLQYPGSVCAGGKANDELPPVPGLIIEGIGPVFLPLTDATVSKLRQQLQSSSSVADQPVQQQQQQEDNTSFGNDGASAYHQISGDKISFANPSWEQGMEDLIDMVCIGMGVDRTYVTAKLDRMLLLEEIEEGSAVDQRGREGDFGDGDGCDKNEGKGDGKDENKDGGANEDVFGTLLVQLPSTYTGGNVRISCEKYEHEPEKEQQEQQPSREVLARAVDLLFLASDEDSVTVGDVCRSLEDTFDIKIDRALKKSIKAHLSDLVTGKVLPMVDGEDHGDATGITASDDSSDKKKEKNKEKIKKYFNLGAGKDAAFGCQYISYYSDCDFKMKAIKSGCRILLAYSLCYSSRVKTKGGDKPNAALICSSIAPLERTLSLLPRADRMLLMPLEYNYDTVSIANCGIDALHEDDRRKAQGLKVAAAKSWKFFVVEAELVNKRVTGYYGDLVSSKNDSSLIQIFDEDGEKMSDDDKKWIDTTIDFTSCETSELGIMLSQEMGDAFASSGCSCGCTPAIMADDYTIEDVWGSSGDVVADSDYNRYNEEGRYRKSTTYKSNFVLAYDTESVFELKALGGREGSEEAAKKVSSARNYDLFQRLVATMKSKSLRTLPKDSCLNLLEMALGEGAGLNATDEDRISFVKSILNNLSSEDEPHEDLYDMILVAIRKMGWYNLVGSVSAIMGDKMRKKSLSLQQFLSRVQFILSAKTSCGTDAVSLFLELSCNDLRMSTTKYAQYIPKKSDRPDTASVMRVVEAMVQQHGFKLLEEVVNVTVDALRDLNNVRRYGKESTDGLLKRTEVLLRLRSAHSRRSIEKHLRNAVEDMIAKVGTPDALHLRKSSEVEILSLPGCLDSMQRLLFKYGTQAMFDRLGKCLIAKESRLAGFLVAVSETLKGEADRPNALVRGILSKCLVQFSTDDKWAQEAGGTLVVSSLHVRKVLEAFPSAPFEKDGDGRLPIHHAVSCDNPSLDNVTDIFHANPKAASMVDPVTGLYPFMSAAMQGAVDASYKLLQADPSIVDMRFGEGTEVVDPGLVVGTRDDGSKKRKRGYI